MTRTIGVEEEFLVLDRDGATLRPLGDRVAEAAAASGPGQFEHELKQEQAELGSSPQSDLASLGDELRRRRRQLQRGCDDLGARLVAVGTAPLDVTSHTTPAHRYEQLLDTFGETARQALSCGMHVHVQVADRDEGVRVLSAIRGWLPLVLALSVNSPFYDGRDSHHESYRTVVWQQWPSAGPFGSFADPAEYDDTVDALVRSGAALDEAGLYLDARLSASYPTVEIRVADVCARVEDAVAIAGLVRLLVSAAATGRLPKPQGVNARTELLRAASWRAARDGVEGSLWHPARGELVPGWSLVDELIASVQGSGGEADDVDGSAIGTVATGLRELRERGTGSRLQRDVFEKTGSLAAVVDALAEVTSA